MMEVKIRDPNYWIVERLREKESPVPTTFKAVFKKDGVEHVIEAKDSICVRYPEQERIATVVPSKIPCSKINVPHRNVDSSYYKALKELIRRDGLKQPITVSRLENGRFGLFDGLLRLRVVKELGLDEIDAHIL